MPELSRRHVLTTATGIVAAASLGMTPSAAAAPGRRVAILGGGVAGLSAAHELVERGFEVTVYERRALGGKARSMPVPGTGRDGRRDLPGEHGFRFFPGFYKNIPDTMRRIPFPGNANGVYGNLVDATVLLTARSATMSEDYRRLLVVGLTRNLVAIKAEVASTHTVAHILEAFLYTAMGRGNDGALDRLLDGPTNEAWIDPWVEHLTRLGVHFLVGWRAESLDYTNGRIAAALVTDPGRIRRRVEADWFVCAVPIERAVLRRTKVSGLHLCDGIMRGCRPVWGLRRIRERFRGMS